MPAEAMIWQKLTAGALLGTAFGWAGTRALQSQLYEVQPLDVWSWTGAFVALAIAVAAAVLRPAYAAAHVDPVSALRAD